MTVDPIAAARISALEKKIGLLVRTNAKIQIQTEEALAKLDKAVTNLRKALPHVNFGE